MSESTYLPVAAIQLYSEPGQLLRNLERAEALVRDAAEQGSVLVVLPELFNIGYQYDKSNYSLAEPRHGRTWSWMTQLAAELNVHLGGSLLIRKAGDIYNTFLLAAPDGRTWEYDKQRPFFWERAYFRPGQQPVVAKTDIGRIGFLICWDAAHPELFASYAGKIDFLIVSAAAPRFHELMMQFPDGKRLDVSEASPLAQRNKLYGGHVFGRYLQDYAAHLNVPSILAFPSPQGRLQTKLPRGRLGYFLGTFPNAWYWRWLPDADRAVTDVGFFAETALLNRLGEQTACAESDEDCVVAGKIKIKAERPSVEYAYPLNSQLLPQIHQMDRLFNWLMRPLYEGVMQQRQSERRAVGWLLGAATFFYLIYSRRKR